MQIQSDPVTVMNEFNQYATEKLGSRLNVEAKPGDLPVFYKIPSTDDRRSFFV